ncbi:ribonuclease III, partial [bacterium]
MSQNDDIKQLEKVLGYKFRNTKLLELSVTHASYTRSHKNSYQRLEFLGDAVISLVVAEFLVKKFPDLDEGELTNIRQQMISQTSLANAAKILGLDKFVRADVKITKRNISDSILCDIF